MKEIYINEKGCCSCGLCEEECPTEVIKMEEKIILDETRKVAHVQTLENCIDCLSCMYICPANVITLKDYHIVKNFYRDISITQKLRKFI
ncbi:MAG: 4Fe-4S dicluster domain-containing protein [Desulfobacterales bacterium]|nr:4Fe-4S dicluster domain-containing protein [Desulfobacterales bacterium]